MRHLALCSLLLSLACDPSVVDAVREPMPLPLGGSSSGGAGGTDAGSPDPGGGSVGESGAGSPPDSPLSTALFHRYSFDGEGDVAWDSRGAAHGQVVGTALAGDGTLPLAGGSTAQFVNLPNGLVSGLTDATFESWLTWHGGSPWQRIFDFGNNPRGEDLQGGTGITYLFLTAFAAADTNRQLPSGLRVVYSQNGVDDEELCNAPNNLPTDVPTHVAVVIDSRAQTMALYQDGTFLLDCPLTRPLSAIRDVNNWLGQSNFAGDAELAAVYDEFRMYDMALTAAQIAASFAAGPDATP